MTVNALASLQDSVFSTWLRESDWTLFALLIVHTAGMGFLVGTAVAFQLRMVGFAPRIELARFTQFMPAMIAGVITAIVSGVLLVVAYPAKALTNPIFYVKLILLATAYALTRKMLQAAACEDSTERLARMHAKYLAILIIVLWVAGLMAGKFLPYTHKVLLVYS